MAAGEDAPFEIKPYDPVKDGLRPDFVLTEFSDVPQEKLLEWLELIGEEAKPNETPGMDCSVVRTRHEGIFLVSTTDFFYPLVEDPFVQGWVAASNVLSDMYAMGVSEVDTVLMLLGASLKMSGVERDVVSRQMIAGFSAACRRAGTSVTGGQTVMNPWPMIGGVAKSVCVESEMIRPIGGEVGDVLVLTKPLGTQVAVNAREWTRNEKRWSRISHLTDHDQVWEAFRKAQESMVRLNRNGAACMHRYKAHGATDVTGFGILGHAQNLAAAQTQLVDLEIHTLPVIKGMLEIDAARDCMFGLRDGHSAETSGGLLVMLPADKAQPFIDELTTLDNAPAWIIGRVVAGSHKARIVDDPTIIEV